MKAIFITYLLLSFCIASAQYQDTVQLQEVPVLDYRSKLGSSEFSESKTDSATKNAFSHSSASQLLLQLNNTFVKAYGPSNIASLSIRGSSAQQTAVVWNGVNINNPMLGQSDISLLPVSLFSNIAVQKGALSAYWGSGAMAGIVNLNTAVTAEGLSLSAGNSYSSLKNLVQQLQVQFGGKRWSSATRLVVDNAANEYHFLNNNDSLEKQGHARSKQIAFVQDITFRSRANRQLGMHAWVQQAERQIPYTQQEFQQEAEQRDRLIRLLADWKMSGQDFSLISRIAFFDESLGYSDRSYAIASLSRCRSFVADLEAQYFFSHGLTLTGGSSNALYIAGSEGYSKQQQLSRAAIFANLGWKYGKLRLSAYGRGEMFDLQTWVPTFGAHASLQAARCLQLSINGGSVYRYPTLNDLYWNPGGNPQLKPEKGYSAEGSACINIARRKITASLSGTIFTRTINNWIMWLPGKNGIWSPQNVLVVWSRGAESQSVFNYNGKVKTSVTLITNYVLSTRTQVALENDASLGRQLPYVPMYSGSAVFFAAYRNVSLRLAGVYTGYRYLTSDNYAYLDPYHILDARLAYTLRRKKLAVDLFAESNNLLNENYYSMARYAMPLRNYRVGIQFHFQKPNQPKT